MEDKENSDHNSEQRLEKIDLDSGESPTTLLRDESRRDNPLVGPLSNFTIQYNISVATITQAILKSHHDEPSTPEDADYPQPVWAHYILLGVVLLGTIIGMAVLGKLGDRYEPKSALKVSLLTTIAGSFITALSFGSPNWFYIMMCLGRFIVGIGVGGIYPLSAIVTRKQTSNQSAVQVGWSFFWQVPGAIAPVLLAYFLVLIFHGRTGFQFRCLFFVGSIPPLLCLYLLAKDQEPDQEDDFREIYRSLFRESIERYRRRIRSHFRGREVVHDYDSTDTSPTISSVSSFHSEHNFLKENFWQLLGCGGSWFVYDVVFYTTIFFAPDILVYVFTNSESIESLILQTLLVSCSGIPGLLINLKLLKTHSCRRLQEIGFLLQSGCFALLSVCFFLQISEKVNLLLLCLLLSTLSFGPGVGTYCLPALVFPESCRSTMAGYSASCGKLGAVFGTFIFLPLAALFGLPSVLVFNSVVAFSGYFLTQLIGPEI